MRTGSQLQMDPFRIPARYRARLQPKRLVPLLVWVIVLLGAAVLHSWQMGGVPVTGFAEAIRYRVAPLVAGRIESLEVRVDQDVVAGQVVAFFDDQESLLEVREARMELGRIAAELGREGVLRRLAADEQQVGRLTELRELARDADSAHIDYLEAVAELAERRMELQGLELTLTRTQKLESDALTSRAALDEDRVAFDALGEWVAHQEVRVDSMFAAHEEASTRYRQFIRDHMRGQMDETAGTDLLLRPFENAIQVQEVRIERLNLAVLRRVLRAPADGRVAELFRREGEVVAAGEPVVSILAPRSNEVVAFVPEDRILDVEAGARVTIRRTADPRQVFESSVAQLGTGVEQIPLRTDPNAMSRSWGVRVSIPLPQSPAIRPGEAFEVFFDL